MNMEFQFDLRCATYGACSISGNLAQIAVRFQEEMRDWKSGDQFSISTKAIMDGDSVEEIKLFRLELLSEERRKY